LLMAVLWSGEWLRDNSTLQPEGCLCKCAKESVPYHPGIIVLRPAVQNITTLLRLMNRVLPLLGQEPLAGCLWIVDDHQVRIRDRGQGGTP
jgi:hypothetical protein